MVPAVGPGVYNNLSMLRYLEEPAHRDMEAVTVPLAIENFTERGLLSKLKLVSGLLSKLELTRQAETS